METKEKTVELNLIHRMGVAQVLPKETNWASFSIKTKILEKTRLTEQEHKKWNIPATGELPPLTKQFIDSTETKIQFSDLECDMISKALNDLDKESKLTDLSGPLYEKFCR